MTFLFPSALDPIPAKYEGEFDDPPVFHYRVKLPGRGLNAMSHSEWSSPIIAGEHIYVGSAGAKALFALSRRDGRKVRAYPADGTVEGEALVTGEHVYFGDTGGTTYCYRLDGKFVWRFDSSGPVLAAPTLTPDGSRVLVTTVDDLVMSLDAATGALAWQYRSKRDLTREAELTLYDAPAAVVVGDLVLLGFSSGTLTALDLASGEEQWKRAIGEGRYPDIVAAPVVIGTDAFVSGYFKPLVAMDLPSQNVRWRVDVGAAGAVLPIMQGDRQVLIHPGSDGKLRAIVALTGAELWTWDSGLSGSLTEPVETPAGLVVASTEGVIQLVDPDDGTLVWRWDERYELEGISARPAVDGRQLVFVSNAGYLYSMLSP